MSNRLRIVFVGLWALSLVAAAQFGASAQRYEPQQPTPGVEIRFRPTGENRQGQPMGQLMALVNGQWLPVTLAELHAGGGIVPLDSRPR
jgi:hypothetical protein